MSFANTRQNRPQPKRKKHPLMVTLSRGGTKERTVPLAGFHIPDLYHVASLAGPVHAEEIRLVWQLAQDLKRELLERYGS